MRELRAAESEKEFEQCVTLFTADILCESCSQFDSPPSNMDRQNRCTFAPKIKDSPAYVKRIAQSMEAQKARRALTNGDVEPPQAEWR